VQYEHCAFLRMLALSRGTNALEQGSMRNGHASVLVPVGMRWAEPMLAFVLISCSGGGVTSGSHPTVLPTASENSPSGTASPVETTPPAAAAATPIARPAVALCWLPGVLRVDQSGKRQIAGYLDVTTGATLDDPAGNVVDIADVPVSAGATSPQWALEAQPALRGEPFTSYSPEFQNWLPVRPEMVAPDGLSYAYKSPDGSLHLMNAGARTDHSVANPNDLNPIGYSKDGVWLVQGGGSGLWLLDPPSQTISSVLAPNPAQSWEWFRGGAIWGFNSSGLPGSPPASSVLHFDLATRSVTTWYSQTGATVTLVAVDVAGAAAIVVLQASSAIAVEATAPNKSSPLTLPAGLSAVSLSAGARQETESHGGWIVSPAGVFLFRSTSGLSRIGPGLNFDFVPGGECL
jgi:hypothetical protein